MVERQIERFNDDARIVLQTADLIAQERNDPFINPVHMFLGMLYPTRCKASGIMTHSGLNRDNVSKHLPTSVSHKVKRRDVSESTKLVLQQAVLVARTHYHDRINSIHLLVGLMESDDVDLRELFTAIALPREQVAITTLNTLVSQFVIDDTVAVVLDEAYWTTQRLNHSTVTPTHLLLGMLGAPPGNPARTILEYLNVTQAIVPNEVTSLVGIGPLQLHHATVNALKAATGEARRWKAIKAGAHHLLVVIIRDELVHIEGLTSQQVRDAAHPYLSGLENPVPQEGGNWLMRLLKTKL